MPIAIVVKTTRAPLRSRCAFCHGGIDEATGERCEACGTLVHPDCHDARNGCPTLGCGNNRRRPKKPGRMSPLEQVLFGALAVAAGAVCVFIAALFVVLLVMD